VIVTFAHFTFDPERRVVAGADGAPLHLTPKAFDLLHVLVDEAPRVVPKEELHRRLWADTFVTDAALTGLVKELRRVLRDGDSASPVIKTTHGVGYALDRSCSRVDATIASVHWLIGPHRRYALNGSISIIGREAACEVRLDEAGVSRRHAQIVISGDRAAIEDLGSKNGTTVGGHAISGSVDLEDGDSIRVGGVLLTYRRQGTDGTTATVATP
jgi:DNA-binding winged helix-turn-helix (wHTH) protein